MSRRVSEPAAQLRRAARIAETLLRQLEVEAGLRPANRLPELEGELPRWDGKESQLSVLDKLVKLLEKLAKLETDSQPEKAPTDSAEDLTILAHFVERCGGTLPK